MHEPVARDAGKQPLDSKLRVEMRSIDMRSIVIAESDFLTVLGEQRESNEVQGKQMRASAVSDHMHFSLRIHQLIHFEATLMGDQKRTASIPREGALLSMNLKSRARSRTICCTVPAG